jgi:hypothetical protein
VAERDQPDSQGAGPAGGPPPGPAPPTVRLEGVVLLDTAASEPVAIEAVLFADDGIGVIRRRGERPRVLPWSSLSAHAVEKWVGGEIPAGWLHRDLESRQEPWILVSPPAAAPPTSPRVGAGALIGIQTSYGTYRFLYPGGDPAELSRRVTAFAVRHHGPSGASTVTRVVAWGQDAERRQADRQAPGPVGWHRVRPYLVVLLLVFLGAVVTLILLQSAGSIHLPLLGGSGSGTIGAYVAPGARRVLTGR